MKSLADGLPPQLAGLIHPDWRENEAGYWAVREGLLESYRNQWIGFDAGRVIISGSSPVAVLHAACAAAAHPFVTCVGREEEPCRMRRSAFPYDPTYPGEPLPLLPVEFRMTSGSQGVLLDRVIPDTGADASALPFADFVALPFDPSQAMPSLIGGVAGSISTTVLIHAWVFLDGQEYPCRLQADLSGQERILGRDVLNRMDVLFRGPTGEVVVNP